MTRIRDRQATATTAPAARRPLGSPGAALIRSVARHWDVPPAAARAILRRAGVTLEESEGWQAVPWEAVWRIEGAPWVPPRLWEAYREPLIRTTDLARRGAEGDAPLGVGQSALRRRIARGHLPVIALGPRTRRVRPIDLEAALRGEAAGGFRS